MPKAQTSVQLHKHIIEVLRYYDYFSYPLTLTEIHGYLGVQSLKKDVKVALESLVRAKTVEIDQKNKLYALRGHRINFATRTARTVETEKKLSKVKKYVSILKIFPLFRLIGVSGSCAMHNAAPEDDIDLFIISAPGRIWTCRITAIFIAKALFLHRSKGMTETANKVCLNLFYDGAHTEVPDHKKNTYIAHEIVQMKPLHIKDTMYEEFLTQNIWTQQFFPNQPLPKYAPKGTIRLPVVSLLFDGIEYLLKRFQLRLMHTPTREIVSDTQLWFFPDDFQDKLKKHIPMKNVR